jgi:hypothetical protein
MGLVGFGCSSNNSGEKTFSGSGTGGTTGTTGTGGSGATTFQAAGGQGGASGSTVSSGAGGASGSTVSSGAGGAGGAGGDTSGGTGGDTSSWCSNGATAGPDAGSVNEFADAAVPVGDGGCGATRLRADPKPANILLIIDKSGSMADRPVGFTINKWTAMKNSLSAALEPAKGSLLLGLEMFPVSPTGLIPSPCGDPSVCCQMPTGATAINVPIESGTTALPKILNAFIQSPAGGTPTAAALKEALAYFTTGAGTQLKGDKYILLATDGAPNCNQTPTFSCDAAHCTTNIDSPTLACALSQTTCCLPGAGGGAACLDDADTIAQVAALKAAGVLTFVVGIPGSESYVSVLDALAVAGGRPTSPTSPKYFAVSAWGGDSGLTTVFKAITNQLLTSCDVQLKCEPPDPDLLNVTIDGALIGRAISDAGGDGWTLDQSTQPSTLKLLGPTCNNLMSKGATSLQVLYGCPVVPLH